MIEKYEECPHGKEWATQAAYDFQRCDCVLRIVGVSRDAESPGEKSVLVAFNRRPTDDELRAFHDCKQLPVATSHDRSIDRLIRAVRQMLEWWESETLSLKDCEDDLRFALKAFDKGRP